MTKHSHLNQFDEVECHVDTWHIYKRQAQLRIAVYSVTWQVVYMATVVLVLPHGTFLAKWILDRYDSSL